MFLLGRAWFSFFVITTPIFFLRQTAAVWYLAIWQRMLLFMLHKVESVNELLNYSFLLTETGTTPDSSLWLHWDGEVSHQRPLTTFVPGYAEWRKDLVITCPRRVLLCNYRLCPLAGWSHCFSDNDWAPPSGGMCQGISERNCTQSNGCPGTTQSHHNQLPSRLKGLYTTSTSTDSIAGLVIPWILLDSVFMPLCFSTSVRCKSAGFSCWWIQGQPHSSIHKHNLHRAEWLQRG